MKHFLILVALVGTALSCLPKPGLGSGDSDFDARLGRVRTVVVKTDFSRAEITRALVEALDASLQILPAQDYSAEFRSRVGQARKMLENGGLLEDKLRQYLLLAYKMVSGGKAWRVPKALESSYREAEIMERAKKVCIALLDSSIAEHKAGRQESAVRDLISFVIFVITPVEAGSAGGTAAGPGVDLPVALD